MFMKIKCYSGAMGEEPQLGGAKGGSSSEATERPPGLDSIKNHFP